MAQLLGLAVLPPRPRRILGICEAERASMMGHAHQRGRRLREICHVHPRAESASHGGSIPLSQSETGWFQGQLPDCERSHRYPSALSVNRYGVPATRRPSWSTLRPGQLANEAGHLSGGETESSLGEMFSEPGPVHSGDVDEVVAVLDGDDSPASIRAMSAPD